MLRYTDLKAVIFDVDDTLLDNHPEGSVAGLHGESRIRAAHEVGKRHGIPELQQFTPKQAKDAFFQAKEHSLRGTVWQMMFIAGVVETENVDPDHPLLNEIMELKDVMHEEVMRAGGRAFPGAIEFVEALAANGLEGKMAIASTAYRRDVDLFLEITNLRRFFPEERVITREQFNHPKPHPDAFNLAYATLGLPDKDRPYVAAFEDDPRGIMSAKAAELYTCAIAIRHDKKALAGLAVPPDLAAGSYAEFMKLFSLPMSAGGRGNA
jgi:HAD superfamily hydrolase (TIGR01509 family)